MTWLLLWGMGCSTGTSEPEPAPAPAPAAPAPAPVPVRQQVQRLVTPVGGVDRTSWLHVPDGEAKGLLPLVVLLHGGAQTDGRRMAAAVDHWFDEGVVFVFPNSAVGAPEEEGKAGKRGKNAQPEEDEEEEVPAGPMWQRDDELTFVQVLADQVARAHPIDRERIYVGGFAEGGELVLELACSEGGSKVFAGFASVAAAMPRGLACPAPGFPKPLLAVSGTDDEDALWTGDEAHLSVTDSVGPFLAKNGCDAASAKEELLPDADASDETRIKRHIWTCSEEPVELLEVSGGGHTWPRKAGRAAPKTSRDIDTMDEIGRVFDLTRPPAPAPEPGAAPAPAPAPVPPPAPAGKAGKRHKHKAH